MELRTASRRVAAFAGAACLLVAPVALADPTAADQALAQSLFDEARGLVASGEYARACPKFAESQRLDPGGGTLLNLALCHEHEGKTATAWTEFNEALSRAIHDGRPEREARAKERIAALAPRLSHLTVRVADGAPADLRVTVDGAPWDGGMRGVAVPVDPGSHVVAARAASMAPWSATVLLGPSADARIVVVPALGSLAPPAGEETPPADAFPSSHAGLRTAGWIVGGAGLAAAAVGSVFGGLALASWNQQQSDCASASRCTSHSDAVGDHSRLETDGTVSTVAFVACGALLAGGAILLLTSRGSRASSATGLVVDPALGPHLATVGLRGSF